MDNGITREAMNLSKIRYLERQLDIEKSKAIFAHERRVTAEAKVDLLTSVHQSHMDQLRSEIVELKKEIAQIKSKKLATSESSYKYQRVARALVEMTDIRDALLDQINAQRKAIQNQNNVQSKNIEEGRLEVTKQLKANINDALLPTARKEYYFRYLKNLDLKNLMALHQHMRFFDERQ